MDTRPLPPGWESQWDSNAGRYFFIDTTKNPPQSTWEDPRTAFYANDKPPTDSDTPPPYSQIDDSTKTKMPSMPSAMPTPYPPNSYNNNNYSTSTPYPPDSKNQQGGYPAQGGYSAQGGYPQGQPQPNSYNPYNQYDGGSATASSSAAAAAEPKKKNFLSKLGLGGSSGNKLSKLPMKPTAALGTAAAVGALSHHRPGKKLGLIGGGLGLGLGGALVGNALFKGFGGGFKGGFKGGYGGDDWGGGCDW